MAAGGHIPGTGGQRPSAAGHQAHGSKPVRLLFKGIVFFNVDLPSLTPTPIVLIMVLLYQTIIASSTFFEDARGPMMKIDIVLNFYAPGEPCISPTAVAPTCTFVQKTFF